MANPLNPNGPGRKVKPLIYYAGWDNQELNAEQQAEFDSAGRPQLGYYQHTSLLNIINNVHTLYVGEDRMFKRARFSDVSHLAQRALQELNYDVSKTEVGIEVELNEANTIPFPDDAIRITGIKFIDMRGAARQLELETFVSVARPVAQDEDYEYQYTEAGDLEIDDKSVSVTRFQEQMGDVLTIDNPLDLSVAANIDENFNIYELRRTTGRYGLNPERAHFNGHYVVDTDKGQIHFNSEFNPGDVMVVQYISDGLVEGADLSRVFVDKFDEEAIEYCILAGLARIFSHPDRQILHRQMRGAVQKAKIRNVDFSPERWRRILRNRNMWIKH